MSERELELEFSVAGQPKLVAFVLVAAYVRTYGDDDDDISRGVGNGEFEENIHVEVVDDDEEGR